MYSFESDNVYLGLLVLLLFIAPALWFLYFQQRTLQMIRPEHRLMRPAQVWLQLIPLFGLVWQFFVVRRISTSIYNQLSAPTGDSILADDVHELKRMPTYSMGVNYCGFFVASLIPIPTIKSLFSLGALIFWIIYWVQLARYKRMLQERALTVA